MRALRGSCHVGRIRLGGVEDRARRQLSRVGAATTPALGQNRTRASRCPHRRSGCRWRSGRYRMTMSIDNVLAGVAVTSLDEAIRWYARVLGAAPRRPMPEVAEWQFASGGALQVFEDPARAGSSSVTFVVDSVDDQIAQLTASGIAIR